MAPSSSGDSLLEDTPRALLLESSTEGSQDDVPRYHTAVTPEGSETRTEYAYHGDNRFPCHVWAGYTTMRTIKSNIETKLQSGGGPNEKLLKIAREVCYKWPGRPRAEAVFDSDGKGLATTSSTSLFRREHDWDKSFDAPDDRIYVSHVAGREEVATIAVTRGQNCLITVFRHGEPTAKRLGTSMSRFVERAVLVDRSWLKGHMLDVVLKNCVRLAALFEDKLERGDLRENACPPSVIDARIEDAVVNGSQSRSAVELTLFRNFDCGDVTVKVAPLVVHIHVDHGDSGGGTLVTSDARLRRIITAYVLPSTGVQRLDKPEHTLIARWLVVLVFLYLKHVGNTKANVHTRTERYEQTLGRHKWAVPLLLHIVACDVQPNFLPASTRKRANYVRMVDDQLLGPLFVSTDKRTATELGAPLGEINLAEPPTNPSCITPGTSGFGVVPTAYVHMPSGPVVHCLNK